MRWPPPSEEVHVTVLVRWMDRLTDRWARRSTFPGAARGRVTADDVVEVHGEYVGEIARPPADVWPVISSPAGLFEGKDAFALPGPGPERWCIVTTVAGGMVGSLVEVVHREEGRRIVLRCVGPETTFVWDWSVFDGGTTAVGPASLLRLTLAATVLWGAADSAERGLQLGARRAVTRIDHLLTGATPPPPLKGALAREGERGLEHRSKRPLTVGEVDVQVVVTAPVEAVWAGVLDPTTYTVDAAPGERSGPVPGTPSGQVGELRYLVCRWDHQVMVRFQEVVAVGPGRRLVLRHHSASHPTESVTTVEPHPQGALVRIVRGVRVHGDGARTLDSVRVALLAHLARLSDELAGQAGGGPDDPDPPPRP